MNYYLVTWNPNRFPWDDLEQVVEKIRQTGAYEGRWSVGNRKRISPGDRVFLLRQGEEPCGIMGSGVVASDGSYPDDYWKDQGSHKSSTARYADIEFDRLAEPSSEEALYVTREFLLENYEDEVNWDTQISGIAIPERVGRELEEMVGVE